ncbi:hypothetical protein C8E84_2823 [Ornithinibacter aureus]|nr:hypothetical protein C8E84_2823 [Ornithinibacter aureus]
MPPRIRRLQTPTPTPSIGMSRIVEELAHLGISTELVWTVEDRETLTSVMIYFMQGGERLLLRPKAAGAVGSTDELIASACERIGGGEVRAVLLSGYWLGLDRPTCRKASQAIYREARRSGAFFMVDLVPHAFFEQVGDFDFVESAIGGKPDLVISEYETLQASFALPEVCTLENLAEAARRVSAEFVGVLVQGRIGLNQYGQALSYAGDYVTSVTGFSDENRWGLGDRMAFEILVNRGIL